MITFQECFQQLRHFNLNVLGLILTTPALKEIASTQNDLPFKLTQLVVLVAFVALGIFAAIRFRIEPTPETQPS